MQFCARAHSRRCLQLRQLERRLRPSRVHSDKTFARRRLVGRRRPPATCCPPTGGCETAPRRRLAFTTAPLFVPSQVRILTPRKLISIIYTDSAATRVFICFSPLALRPSPSAPRPSTPPPHPTRIVVPRPTALRCVYTPVRGETRTFSQGYTSRCFALYTRMILRYLLQHTSRA